MFKTSIALILIALQSVSALPGRLHLCFEKDGSLCCIEGGSHECECDHDCAPPSNEALACAHEEHDEPCHCGDELDSTELSAEDSSHQHVIIAIADHDSVLWRVPSLDADEVPNSYAMMPIAGAAERDFYCCASIDQGQFDSVTASFSLFARASTVLRC